MRHTYALIIPALNEAESVGILLRSIPRDLFSRIVVVDNGSRDRTAQVAAEAGAEVVAEPARGYGQACISGVRHVGDSITTIAFMDADLSDNPNDLAMMVRQFDEDRWDLLLGSRVMGNPDPGSLTPLQRFGNWLSTRLIAMIWRVRFTDLGPLRIVRLDSLLKMNLCDRTFGWNVEMQARAAQLGLRVHELPVSYGRRLHGRSKISGNIAGSLCAGIKILWTILRCCFLPRHGASSAS